MLPLIPCRLCRRVVDSLSAMGDILLQSTKLQITQALGAPLKEVQEGEFQILSYASKAPTLADVYYLQNGRLVFHSQSHYLKPRSFTEFTTLYGDPAYSVTKAKPGSPDSLQLTVHIWPESGRAVTTIGASSISNVIREDVFAGTTLKEYLAIWGKEYSGHTQVTIAPVAVSTQAPAPASRLPLGPQWMVLGSIVLFVVVVVVLIVFVRRRKRTIQTTWP